MALSMHEDHLVVYFELVHDLKVIQHVIMYFYHNLMSHQNLDIFL